MKLRWIMMSRKSCPVVKSSSLWCHCLLQKEAESGHWKNYQAASLIWMRGAIVSEACIRKGICLNFPSSPKSFNQSLTRFTNFRAFQHKVTNLLVGSLGPPNFNGIVLMVANLIYGKRKLLSVSASCQRKRNLIST